MKTYLRSTMGQERLTNTALMNIERRYFNVMLKYDVEKIIDAFGKKNNRASQFFKLTLTKVQPKLCRVKWFLATELPLFSEIMQPTYHLTALSVRNVILTRVFLILFL